ncbi:MAG: glycosyltransferase family 4 protein [Acidobacteriia bacterium]|nr:glycosyltransferase family 4 protein [Terriglobia bacterium]
MVAASQIGETREGAVAPPGSDERVSVCHIASGDRWAGAEVQIATALRFLSQRQDVSISAVLFHDGRLARELRDCGVPVQVIDEATHGFFSIVSDGSVLVRKTNPVILHSHGYKANTVSFAIAMRCGIPHLVRSQHGLAEPFTGIKRWKNRVLQAVDGMIGRYRTDRVISVSDEMRVHLARTVSAKKVVIIRNGLDCTRVQSSLSPGEAKLRLGLPADAVVIGSAGRLEPVKRLERLVRAATLIVRDLPSAHVVIAGDGNEENRLRELAQASDVRDRIHFLGHRDDIFDVLRAIDVFVICSDHEGLPMVLLEAMWLGLPVVASAVGGMADVIENGVSGVLLPVAGPEEISRMCVRIAHDPALRMSMTEKARRRVREDYSAEQNAAGLAELYRSLSEPSSAGRAKSARGQS